MPKNSANRYYGKDGKLHYIDGTIPYSLLWETECTPCWSVVRLMEIYDTCVDNSEEWPIVKSNISYVINIIVAIDYAVRECRIDFLKKK